MESRSEADGLQQDGAARAPSPPPPRSRWILNSWSDLMLFVATPVLIVPIVAVIQSDRFGVTDAVLSTMVAAFGAMGHHLPGMIRAYGDRALFRRFRARFIVAPLFLMGVCVPLAFANLSGMLVILLLWGLWHGLMQVYGFVRIYDARVGSNAPLTAQLDWLMCLCWFVAGLLYSDGRMVGLLESWYLSGGPLIPPSAIHFTRQGWALLTGVITAAFVVNHVRLSGSEQKPNPVKLLMLASGIGFWWFAMVGIRNIVLGIALFEIFHDIQYLAIVWVYNRKRVEQSDSTGGFMRFLFRRSFAMVALYVGLVAAYGMLGMRSSYGNSETTHRFLVAVIWSSTLLHFYFDGFIWKVREKSTRQGLGLDGGADATRRWWNGEIGHVLKWSPFVALVLFMTVQEDFSSEPPPAGSHTRIWPDDVLLERQRNITEAVPTHADSKTKLAVSLDEAGQSDEAGTLLAEVMESNPNFADAWLVAGSIAQRMEDRDEARRLLEGAVERYSKSRRAGVNVGRYANAHFRLGELLLMDGKLDDASQQFQAALAVNTKYEPARLAIEAIEQRQR